MMVKLWRPVGRHEVSSSMHIRGDTQEDEVNVTSGQCTDQTLSPVENVLAITDSDVSIFPLQPDSLSKLHCSVIDCANINAVWASLIIEECTRLGLKYFCIAPGSILSPLAVAASSHRLTTCISCFDERALAINAVGYTKGSFKSAVIITSSGTTISNVLPAVRYLTILTSCRNAAIYNKLQAVISYTWC
ncbi:hypothetical protein NE237_030494 [Protea cynaroides]|uniref:Thiamine pyrophosphate enzyme N-terminal TPP-binding domain-containing protein n=1 Tax=Protea cynaroides TaxID=273540 RepID=A0A9Q0GT55_9MAGN|nr:hypothetical protein NE237_030494 [Protea cynaroides]